MLTTFRTHLWRIFLLPHSRYAFSFLYFFSLKTFFYASTNDSKVYIYWCLMTFIKELFPTVCIVTWLYTTIFSCIWRYSEVQHLFTFIKYIWVFLSFVVKHYYYMWWVVFAWLCRALHVIKHTYRSKKWAVHEKSFYAFDNSMRPVYI